MSEKPGEHHVEKTYGIFCCCHGERKLGSHVLPSTARSLKEEHHQHPHTDYAYPVPRKRTVNISGYHFAWAAIVPTNIEGTCLNVWEKAGYPKGMHIKYKEIFFL
jgi:hypothetical protein